jgi:predicted ribosome quality control (RQC) complex YloA/Tae2 family protein
LDLDLLARLVDELAAVLPGARVDRVVPGKDNGLYVVLHKRNRNLVLLLSPDRSLPRIHLVSRRPAGAATPAGFVLSLRKHLTGSRLQHIGIVNNDRVVEMGFSRDGMTYALIFELTGSGANLLLTDGARTIVSVHRPVPPGDRVLRPLLPGLAYSPPEQAQHAVSRSRPAARREMPLQKGEGSTPVNSAAEAWYAHTAAEQEVSSLRRQLASAVRKASARTERRRAAVASDIAAAEQGDDLRAAGELLLANKHRIAKGQERAELAGFDGRAVSIALDPSRSPVENAERYFRRYKKAKSGLAILRERYAESLGEAAFLNEAQEDLMSANGRDDLLSVRSLLMQRGYMRGPSGKPAGAGAPAPPYRAIDHEGWQIVVGKSAAGNDHITTKLARPDDLWLHAEGMPGSHVLVRNPEKRDVPEGVLRKAASLAAYYSKGRNSSKVAVAYTSAKYVKKPRGAAPGTVTLAERRTVMAVPAPD